MLIDPVPDPGPGPRPARAAALLSADISEPRSDSFGAVLARFDRAPLLGASVLSEPEASLDEPNAEPRPPEAIPEAEGAPEREVQVRAGGDEEEGATDTASLRHPQPERPMPDAHAPTGRADATTQTPSATPLRHETDARPPAPSAPITAARVRPGDALPVGRAPFTTPSRGEAPAVPDAPRPTGQMPAPAETPVRPGPEAPPLPAREPMTAAAPRPGSARSGPEPGRVPPETHQPSNPAMTRPAPESVASAPPLAESVLKARLSETRLSGLRLPDGVAARVFEAGMSWFGPGLGEPGAASLPADATGERFLRAANPVAAEVARDIAQQIGARIMPLARGQFEMTLAPAELGRLEIALREVDGVMTLSVTAERPETLDLIRRHVDLLAQELRQIAQRELLLQLGTGGTGGGAGSREGRAREQGADTADATSVEGTVPVDTPPVILRDHLDLRL